MINDLHYGDGVKQSEYTTESNILRRLSTGAHFSIIAAHWYIHGSIIQLFRQKLSFKFVYKFDKNFDH